MRSKTFQRILEKANNQPLHFRFIRYVKIELYCIKCLGLVKYLKHKFKK